MAIIEKADLPNAVLQLGILHFPLVADRVTAIELGAIHFF